MEFKKGDNVIIKGMSMVPYKWDGPSKLLIGRVREILEVYDDVCRLPSLAGTSLIEKKYLLPVPKPGDKIKLRCWKDIYDQYGLKGEDNIIISPEYIIDRRSATYCGSTVTVTEVNDRGLRIEDDKGKTLWHFATIEEVYEKKRA